MIFPGITGGAIAIIEPPSPPPIIGPIGPIGLPPWSLFRPFMAAPGVIVTSAGSAPLPFCFFFDLSFSLSLSLSVVISCIPII